ncbi:hypothetical protein [Bradyrhizobium sp. LHD-71]|uniref:hypothetical protein n=1 Tax=Bradyrhizobium sp. LHD-71 TaxID=3072141 RepID=UPI00280EA50D|nr:hypothetical protein [Bradyrhizobium sp. LHD-71]MDQ8730849.1 hypothetical protein [Bradyrhizobium sp. LHD-71]
MKFWFTKKSPQDAFDVKAPYDATVEQTLRVAQEVNAAPVEAERELFDFAEAFRPKAAPAPMPAPTAPPPQRPSATPPPTTGRSRPTVSRAAREEMERRIANYRAFQIKLNEEREARIRRTMDDVRARLKQSSVQNSSLH